MSKKQDIQTELTKLGIAFDPTDTIVNLEALLPADDAVRNEPEDPIDPADGEFVVMDPEQIIPKVLPLLVNPPAGETWKNPEQAEYAKILNAAAYCHPDSWMKLQQDLNGKDIPNSAPKHVELARLKEIGTNPSRFYFYTGTVKGDKGTLTFKNKAMEGNSMGE